MASAVSRNHDLEGVEVYGVEALGRGIHSEVNTGLQEVDLGDVPFLVGHGVMATCAVDQICQNEACQVVDGELKFLSSNE